MSEEKNKENKKEPIRQAQGRESCPLCKVSEETIKILKEKAPALAKASTFALRASADRSAGKKDKKI